MAIKWRGRMALIFVIFLFTLGLHAIILGFSHIDNYSKNYFKTDQFQGKYHQFLTYLSTFELNEMTKEEAKEQIVVTKDEINEHRYRYGSLSEQVASIQGQYKDKIHLAKQEGNQTLVEVYTKERDTKIEDIKSNFTSDDHVREKIVKEKEKIIDEYYEELERSRADFIQYKKEFSYYLTNTKTGKVYSNNDGKLEDDKMIFMQSYPSLKNGYLTVEGNYHYQSASSSSNVYSPIPGLRSNIATEIPVLSEDLFGKDITKVATFEGQIGIPKHMLASSLVLADYNDFKKKQTLFFSYLAVGMIAFVMSVYLLRKNADSWFTSIVKGEKLYQAIPLDVKAFAFFIFAMITLTSLTENRAFLYHNNLYNWMEELFMSLFFSTVLVILMIMQGKYLIDRYRSWAAVKEDWHNSICMRFYQLLKATFLNRSVGTQTWILLIIVYMFGLGTAVVAVESEAILLYAPMFILFFVPLTIVILKKVGYFNRILIHAADLANGKMEPDLPVKGKSVLAKLAQHINTLKYGVKTSQMEQAKSERLKTELITNVSHDLRTPLTSIISYTELLKTPNITDDERNSYVEIIDRKSKRLKVLIDDLFEASKMASGSIELVKARIDLVQLLEQALAEHDDKIKESGLHFRVTKPDSPLYVIVDGQKMWRVFDNLIGNILKYSLENTRVYISIKATEHKAIITFKNVTKYELGENINEMFERFKRGDQSRQTEGSGLGLAIAKSIVDLHEGHMDIDIDGDLFKVTIQLQQM